MENHNNIHDSDLNRLLKLRLLEQEDEALLEAEAKLVFSSTVVIAPDVKKEEAFLKKLKKAKGKFWKWLWKGMGVVIGTAALLYAYQQSTRHTAKKVAADEQLLVPETENTGPLQNNGETESVNYKEIPGKLNEQQLQALVSNEQKSTIKGSNLMNLSRSSYLGIYKGQLIGFVKKENGDCSSPIIIRDSNIVLVNSPIGFGNEQEISGSAADNKLYLEKEHNTVWYKFSVKKDCKLAFDITPMNGVNNFDFMLFQYNEPNFSSQIKIKKILPIRTCISGSDEELGNKTGLQYDEQAPAFVHSEQGPSYVKYVNAQKGQTFYLLVDGVTFRDSGKNVIDGRRGYTIRFHYKEYDPDELYVGKSVLATNIYFVPDKPEFLPNSAHEAAIDSIYYFLKGHPKIRVEIQGHVNSIEPQKLNGKKTPSQELSERRARAVFACLVAKGVDPRRMLPVGYAGARKRIQHPKTVPESSKNVRVDIVVLSMDFEADEKLGFSAATK